MTDLGFIVNPEKSDLIPTQKFSFLGEDFDLVEGLVQPTVEKVTKIQALCRILKKHPCQEARFLLKVLGVMNAVADVIPLGRLHMCPLQLCLLSQWSMSTQPLSCKVFLNSFFQEHLEFEDSSELPHQISVQAYLQMLSGEPHVEDCVPGCFGFRQAHE